MLGKMFLSLAVSYCDKCCDEYCDNFLITCCWRIGESVLDRKKIFSKKI